MVYTMKQFGWVALGLTTLAQRVVGDSTCATDTPTASAPYANLWRPLSDEELSSATDLLVSTLNLTPAPSNITTNINITYQVNALMPNKSDALLAMTGNGTEPPRYARATIEFLANDSPYLQEYVVGPLPATNETTVEPLTFPFNNKEPGKSKLDALYSVDQAQVVVVIDNFTSGIFTQLFNMTIGTGGILPRAGSVQHGEGDEQWLWAEALAAPTLGFDAPTILPLGCYFRVNTTDRDVNNWSLTGWYYHNVFYADTDALQTFLNSTGFVASVPSVDGDWTSTDMRGEPLASDESAPPVTVSEGKRRYAVDTDNNYVTWMDFSFFLASFGDQGVSLFDIQYKGKRIIYELALQEALAHYAGADPSVSEILYFDSQEGMGTSIQPLVQGYDCPTYATYLNASFTDAAGVVNTPNGICMFEADSNYPIRRHFGNQYGYTSVAKNIEFTVRWIATVGNYDYLFDYKFFYDGSIEVGIRASGYISAAYYYGNEDYGFKIHDALSGSMHDHVITFKADLDILGTKNSLQNVKVVPASTAYPWSDGKTINTMKITREYITSEDDSSLNWAPNDAAQYAIVNKDAQNQYGEYPGYRIKRASGATYLTVKNSTNAGNAANYANAHLYVTQQKDTEPRAADRNNPYDIADPIVDFCKFLDGDSLDQEDLVVWFNLGMHHVPHTGDLPNTMMTSAHSAIRIEPLNYLDSDPSIQSYQQIKVNNTDGSINTFGAQAANCSVDLSTLYDSM